MIIIHVILHVFFKMPQVFDLSPLTVNLMFCIILTNSATETVTIKTPNSVYLLKKKFKWKNKRRSCFSAAAGFKLHAGKLPTVKKRCYYIFIFRVYLLPCYLLLLVIISCIFCLLNCRSCRHADIQTPRCPN